MPATVFDIRIMHVRLPLIFVAVLIAAIDWHCVSARQWRIIYATFTLAMILRIFTVTNYWLLHSAEVGELRQSFEKIERGSAVLAAVNGEADTGAFHYFSLSYAVLDRQIFTPALYPDIHMLSMKPDYQRLTRLVALPVELNLLPTPGSDISPGEQGDYWSTWWRDFSYILVYSRKPIDPVFSEHLTLISEGSFFRLYEIKQLSSRSPHSAQ